MKREAIAGIVLILFLVTTVFSAIPVEVSAQFTSPNIVIGVVGPKGWIQWNGLWEGAIMARNIINGAGGMKDAEGNGHKVVLVSINEHSVPIPKPDDGKTELLKKLKAHPDMQFLIGGFRDECVFEMREAAMDFAAANGRPIWFIVGASEDAIISDIQTDYERYKYMFRVTPMNGTTLFKQILGMLLYAVQPKLSAIYGAPLKTKIVAEDLLWADRIVGALEYYLGVVYGPGGSGQFSLSPTLRPSAMETDFSGTFATIYAEDVKLVVHLFSSGAGAAFINYYGATQQQVAIAGINAESQMFGLYQMIGGNCEYETILATVGSVQGRDYDVNPFAKPLTSSQFWAQYVASFGDPPIYTAWGAYDAIIALNETAPQWIGKPIEDTITLIEQTERAGIMGVFKYTGPNGKYHDVFCDVYSVTPWWVPVPGYGPVGRVRSWITQWYDGELEVVFPVTIAPDGTYTSPPLPFARKYRIPPRMYSLAESDWVTDGIVDIGDIAPIQMYYGSTPPWTLLSADMDNNNYLDDDDVTRISLDWGKNATQIYGQWPLP